MALAICEDCKTEFKPGPVSRGKFCTMSCAARTNNRKFPKRKAAPTRYCLHCNDALIRHQKSFCSVICSATWRNDTLITNWIQGHSNGSTTCGELSKTLRQYLINQCGNRCPKCGWSEVNPLSGAITLTIDHKDGDSTNHAYDNLEVLCYNCHTLTPTFNQLNRGKGTRYTPGQRMSQAHHLQESDVQWKHQNARTA